MPVARGRGRPIRPGNLAGQNKRKCRQRQDPPPPSQLAPLPVRPTPRPSQLTPPQEEEVYRGEEEEGQEEHGPPHQGSRQYRRDTDGKIITRSVGQTKRKRWQRQDPPPPSQPTPPPSQHTPPQEEEVDWREEEEGQEEHDPPYQGSRQYQRDTDGKTITRSVGQGDDRRKMPRTTGKMPRTTGRGTLIQPDDLAAQTKRRRSQRLVAPPPSQPARPLVQLTPPLILQLTPSLSQLAPPPLQRTPPPSQQTPQEEEKEEEEEHDRPHQLPRRYQKDIDGKIIIRPIGRGWTPASAAAFAIRNAIQTQFQGPYHCWSATPAQVKESWWKIFRDKVSWDSCHHERIYNTFKQRCTKRLSDILSKVRKKGKKPTWMGDEAWVGLLAHWGSQDFQKVSTQNKTNRASSKGGVVHTTGRKSHLEVALDMTERLGRSVDPDELFLATHKKKSGDWVDNRSQRTYDTYRQRLTHMQQTQVDEVSSSGTQEVDGAKKLEMWQKIVGGKSRGLCYGTADLSSNLQRGISSLTQESFESEEVVALRNVATRAEEKATRAEKRAARAEARYDDLESRFQAMMERMTERMTTLERQSGGASSIVSQRPRHSHYEDDLDDQSLDEASSDD